MVQVIGEKEKQNILRTVKAIEGYVMCSCIAMGLLQLIALRYSLHVPESFFRYLRTPANFGLSRANEQIGKVNQFRLKVGNSVI